MSFRSDDKFIVYPVYFDKSLSRSEGRRIPKKDAVDKPSIEDLANAAKSLGLHPVIEKNVAHPSIHWKQQGRLLVDKTKSKEMVLKQIAKRL